MLLSKKSAGLGYILPDYFLLIVLKKPPPEIREAAFLNPQCVLLNYQNSNA